MATISELVFVDGDGFHYPDFPTVLESLKDEYRTIYGSDVYLEPDSQDGQWLGVVALALFDCVQVAAAVYNSFSPLTALSDALSRNVKINGIRRRVPTNSQVDLVLTGQAGTEILGGIVADLAGNRWDVPDVTIPLSGEVTVTATAQQLGAIAAPADTITSIVTPTRGWQQVTNPLPATAGDPSETDAELRSRQTESTMIPSLSVMEGIVGAVAGVNGVLRHRGYENDTGTTDENGIPGHTIALVVEGGVNTEIAGAIARKKTAGTGTWAPAVGYGNPAYDTTSVDSRDIETGSVVLTVNTGLPWVPGDLARISSQADPANYMEGTVTDYTTDQLTVDVDVIGGAGTFAAWDIKLVSLRGGTTVVVDDQFGVPNPINFIRPTPVTITVAVGITAMSGFVLDTTSVIALAVADYLNGLAIGDDVFTNRLFTPANLGNVGDGATYHVDAITISRTGVPGLSTDNLVLAYNEMPVCIAATDVVVTPA